MKKIVIAMVCCLATGTASAADRNPLDASLLLDVGWFFLSTDMRVRLDGDTSANVGTDIDFDDTFGIGDFNRFRADALWRIADSRHAIRAMYFDNNRSASRAISSDINFGDQTFPVGASVTASSELSVIQASYDYTFLQRDSYQLAAGIGVHMLDMGLSLSATVTTPGGTGTREIREDASTAAPLPVVGIRGLWRLPHNFYLTAQAQFFYVEYDPYSGGISDLKATVVWQATPHVGIGVGYNDFRFRVNIEDEGSFDGRLRWNYGGAVAFASFMF